MPSATKPAASSASASTEGGPGSAPDFETALGELERIVADMESGEMTLEQSLAAHKRGLELAQICQTVLARAQQQVKILEENALRVLDDPAASS